MIWINTVVNSRGGKFCNKMFIYFNLRVFYVRVNYKLGRIVLGFIYIGGVSKIVQFDLVRFCQVFGVSLGFYEKDIIVFI